MTAAPSDHAVAATMFAGGLWAGIRLSGGPRPETLEYRHLPGVFDREWIGTLPLPVGTDRPARQTVALGGGGLDFDRPATAQALDEGYRRRPRTRIYESIEARSGGWPERAARYLMRLAGCQVTFTLYESQAGDDTLGPHWDQWYGAIVQLAGTKTWRLGDDITDIGRDTATVTTQVGDVLFLPAGLLHDVRTPDYSLHLGVALLTHEPLHTI